jgi:hypothetical protein
MLSVTIVDKLGGREHQWKLVPARIVGRHRGFDESRQRMLARVPKNFRKYLNLASVRFESVLAVSEIVRLAGNADTARLRPQVFECEIERANK